jgi:hypothetical protein
MDDDCMVTAFVVLDQLVQALGHRDDVRAQASDAAVLTVAAVAAKPFQNRLARALGVLLLGRYRSGPRSVSRFNRRSHRLAEWPELALETLGALRRRGGLPHRQHAGAGPSPRPRPPLPHGPWPGLLRFLCRQAGAVLRLATAPQLYHGRAARPDAGPRTARRPTTCRRGRGLR